MYAHILIPTDGSETADRGLDHGLALAAKVGARVTVITATEALPSYSGVGTGFGLTPEVTEAYDRQQAAHAQALLDAAKARAAAAGVACDTLHVPQAHAAEAIVEAARTQGADLIVMASHGRRGLGRLFLGSQAAAVVNQSPVPVLVVR
jgi:nucleotide-binding universal stress UspA family protein